MPSVESFKETSALKAKSAQKKNAKAAKSSASAKSASRLSTPSVKKSATAAAEKTSAHSKKPRTKRRLALEGMAIQEEVTPVSVVDMDDATQMNQAQGAKQKMSDSEGQPKDKGYKFNFSGSDLLRSRFPKTVKLSEVVVDEWLKDGKFENLPIEHPIVEVLTQKGLRKAKEMEQQFFQNPKVEKAVIQALTLGFKVQNLYAEAKKKISRNSK